MITIESPLDMHLHLREGVMLQRVAPLSAAHFAGAVIMPNLLPPVETAERLAAYRQTVLSAVPSTTFTPYMTLFFRSYTHAELAALRDQIIGIKLYPSGVTTNSEHGVRDIDGADATLSAMEQLGIPLLVHGETHGFVLDREHEFLPVYDRLARRYPRLTLVMEHITTRAAVDFLDTHPNVYATITLHHLLITLDDLAGGLLKPHLFCKPIAKRPADRDALLEAALAAHPRVMFGSDSAPHPLHSKEAANCCAGVFSAPVALPVLAALFAKHGALGKLQAFVSDNACRIYGITPPRKQVQLREHEWQVPVKYGDIVPFLAGERVAWHVSEVTDE